MCSLFIIDHQVVPSQLTVSFDDLCNSPSDPTIHQVIKSYSTSKSLRLAEELHTSSWFETWNAAQVLPSCVCRALVASIALRCGTGKWKGQSWVNNNKVCDVLSPIFVGSLGFNSYHMMPTQHARISGVAETYVDHYHCHYHCHYHYHLEWCFSI